MNVQYDDVVARAAVEDIEAEGPNSEFLWAQSGRGQAAQWAKYDPLIRPTGAPDGRWTVDAWAPTDGFTVNGGIRLSFGG